MVLAVFATVLSAAAWGDPASDISGNWVGTSKVRCGGRLHRVGRCNALQNITFEIKQAGSKISGTYKCAFGTQDCLGLHERGIVNGSFDGAKLIVTVDMGTGSTCQFKGGIASGTGQGSYSCSGSGGPEQGTWRIHREGTTAVPKAEQVPPALRPHLP